MNSLGGVEDEITGGKEVKEVKDPRKSKKRITSVDIEFIRNCAESRVERFSVSQEFNTSVKM